MQARFTYLFVLLLVNVFYFAQRHDEETMIKMLADGSQSRRDSAAEILGTMSREGNITVAPGHIFEHTKKYWDSLLQKIPKGMPWKKALKILDIKKPEGVGWFACSGGSCVETFRLDNTYVLSVSYESNQEEKIISRTLSKHAREIFVPAPRGFTGVWITYYINGQKSDEINYQKGKYNGKFTTYHDNGKICTLQNYVDQVSEGEDFGYYANGQLMYRGRYLHSKQEGQWLHYYENGQMHAKTNYVNGTMEGEDINWYENGQMIFKSIYVKGEKVYEKAWNEKGVLQYEHDWRNKTAK